jgi:hypothetical protein
MTNSSPEWGATKERIQQRWPALSEDELEATQGERLPLVALLESRLGYAHGNAEQDMDEILGGELVVPADVADETRHTGTAGPVGPLTTAPPSGGDSAADAGLGHPSEEASTTRAEAGES